MVRSNVQRKEKVGRRREGGEGRVIQEGSTNIWQTVMPIRMERLLGGSGWIAMIKQ
jgi:hypothetical protein